MAKNWGWTLRHTLDAKKYSPHDTGQVASATIRNTGEATLRVYGFGIEFEYQRKARHWWSQKCNILLGPQEEAKLPVVTFQIPIDIELRTHKYRPGAQTESAGSQDEFEPEWQDHGVIYVGKEYEIQITPHAGRDYKVFISHSNHNDDKEMMNSLSTLLFNNGIERFIAEESPRYGENLWKKIKRGIFSADRVVILWTKHGAKSEDVREELGITVGARKAFIPIIEKNVKPKGSLIGTEYVRLERNSYKDVFINLAEELIKGSVEKAKRVKKVKPEEDVPF